jgi:hypothetical protein
VSDKPRYFTLDQAQAALEIIRPLVDEILEIRQSILKRQPEIWPVLAKAAGNGGSKVASEIAQEFARLDQNVRMILATGALLKDVNLGLVDFPYWHEDREIYLCWKYGEESISFWHEIDSGFSGRQPVFLLTARDNGV